MNEMKFQIGKNGLTPGVLQSLLVAFKTHKQIRIYTLKASGRNRENIENMAKDLINQLSSSSSFTFDYKIIGFTIILRKHFQSNKSINVTK